ncbi:MAG TPA: hypothetical protein D7H99_08185 [Candidatus Poseidoniales archaeon]|nr:MAG TPA: hypothetical protein D7H99_08185 [Candidatus Poseidoniales archaeon]
MLLDGAVDLQQGCQAMGLRYALHLARSGHRESVLKELSQTASCIVTDMFPLPPWSHWVANVGKDAKCPVVEVDCHCVIPMPLFGKSVDRPFKFRDATKRMRKKMVQQSWPKVTVENQSYDGELPFIPIDIEADILDHKNRIKLLQECNIDPTVLPVWSQRGGEKIALNKWQKFLENNLSGYARRRNNAADPEGVSRLSAAFHYGFLSPMKVAREAAAIGTKSADKYLDELLIFREHAWHHVASKSKPYSSANLPHWALESWNNTAQDPRPVIVSSHELEYARSPNLLWNLCQKSLLRHGELHNNLRMTWGKSFPRWTTSLEDSLLLSQKYNDKYALDGRDPSSIAGVQWCHGLFDRPFFPSMPVMGVVRKRELETHNSRLDTEAYARQINRSPNPQQGVFLVCGNTLIDCYVARVLSDNGYYVNYYEESENQSLTNNDKNLLDTTELPKYMRDRVDSIMSKLNTISIKQISDSLLRGIPKVTLSQINWDKSQCTLIIKSANKSSPVISTFYTNLDFFNSLMVDLEEPNSQVLNRNLLGQKPQQELTLNEKINLSLWNLAECIFNINRIFAKPKMSIQTKLI